MIAKRVMSEDAMVTLVAASASEVSELEARMAPLRNGEVMPWLKEGVNKGYYEFTTVVFDGVPTCVFWAWHSKGNNSLVCNAVGSLRSDTDVSEALVSGLIKRAREIGATSISFQTARRGLIQKMRQRGFKVEGVLMRRML